MAMPSRYELVASGSGGNNVLVDTGQLDVADFECLNFDVMLVGGVAPASLSNTMYMYDTAGTIRVMAKSWTITTGAGGFSGSAGPGAGGTNGGGTFWPGPLGAKFRLVYAAFGAGITSTWSVSGRRNHRGPDLSLDAD